MEDNYPYQICQDEKLIGEFSNLHEKLVNEVIQFCKEHNLEIDEFHLSADGVRWSVQFGQWTPATDSSFCINRNDDKKPFVLSC